MEHHDRTDDRPQVSVVIVNYETPEALDACVTALAANTAGPVLEVFVIDNASRDFDSALIERALPGARVIRNPNNVGFAQASNEGLRLAAGRYFLLLNPDTEVAPDTIAAMVGFMDEHPDVGCATARLELPDGSLDLACRRSFPTPMRAFYRVTQLSRLFPRSHRFGQYNLTYLDEHTEADIDAPCGAFMMVRAETVRQVGPLDERYFMYGEDLDWAFRIKGAGWRIMYTPVTTVRHVKGASSRRWRGRTIRYFHEAMRIFYREHYASEYPRWVSWLVFRTISAREITELAALRLGWKSH